MFRTKFLRLNWLGVLVAVVAIVSTELAASTCHASGHGGGHGGGHHAPAEAEVVYESTAPIRGIKLGDYRIRAYYPVEAQKSTVRFAVHAAVAKEHHAAAKQVAEAREMKIRDEIIIATRMSPITIFDDASFTDFRRRILVRLRRAVPELPIDDIYVSDFSLTVKSL
jgi:hypothetical protein